MVLHVLCLRNVYFNALLSYPCLQFFMFLIFLIIYCLLVKKQKILIVKSQFFKKNYWVFKNLKTRKVIDYGRVENDLYLWNMDFVNLVGASIAKHALKLDSLMTVQWWIYQWHNCIGHPSFVSLNRIFSTIFKYWNVKNLLCDAWKFVKHTCAIYSPINKRGITLFITIHYDVWGHNQIIFLSRFFMICHLNWLL
jgi:hypothetical protein